MKTHFIRELEPDQVITSFFIVHSKEVRYKKTGEPYLSLTFADRTGHLDAKMWDGVPEVIDTFDQDDFVKVKGLVQVFRNRLQMTVHKLRRVEDADVDFADYFPHTDKNVDEMWAAVRAAVAGVRNDHLRALLEAFLNDEEIARRFKIAPAAKSLHHARLGGLLEHVVSLLGLCRTIAAHYDFIDLDFLVAAAVLHDLGKIYELRYERSFSYSTEGQLLGHMILVLDMLQAKAASVPGFPPKLKALVEHMILSHHGHYEFGSPKLPMFPEALLFHYLDDLDSKLESMRATIAGDPNIEGDWTMYNASLERPLLKKEKFLSERPEMPAKEAGAAQSAALGRPPERRGGEALAEPAAAPRGEAAGVKPEPVTLGQAVEGSVSEGPAEPATASRESTGGATLEAAWSGRPAEVARDTAGARQQPAARNENAGGAEPGETAAAGPAGDRKSATPGLPPLPASAPAAPRQAKPGAQTVFGELLQSALKEDGGSE